MGMTQHVLTNHITDNCKLPPTSEATELKVVQTCTTVYAICTKLMTLTTTRYNYANKFTEMSKTCLIKQSFYMTDNTGTSNKLEK